MLQEAPGGTGCTRMHRRLQEAQGGQRRPRRPQEAPIGLRKLRGLGCRILVEVDEKGSEIELSLEVWL